MTDYPEIAARFARDTAASSGPDTDPFWVKNRAEFLAAKSTAADPSACGTCRSNVAAGEPVEHDGCAQRATLLHAPDHPYYEILAGFSLEENAKLPARFHVPVFDDCGVPNSWLCAVCQDEGTVTGWPCATAIKHGTEVFSPLHQAETAHEKQAARIFDRFRDGIVITVDVVGEGEGGTAVQGPVEEAVLDLVTGESVRSSPVLERAA